MEDNSLDNAWPKLPSYVFAVHYTPYIVSIVALPIVYRHWEVSSSDVSRVQNSLPRISYSTLHLDILLLAIHLHALRRTNPQDIIASDQNLS